MSSSLPAVVLASKGNAAVPGEGGQDNSLVLKRRLLREACDEHPEWTHEAIVAAMKPFGICIDATYFSKMLAGEKPIGLKHIDALPDEIEATYYRLQAEHFGLIVIERVDDATAERYLAIALFSKLSRPALPKKTTGPIKADLRRARKAVGQ